MRTIAPLLVLSCLSFPLHAETPADIQSSYARQAGQESLAYAGPSAAGGQQFFQSKHGKEWSCASCHTSTPTGSGRHQVTGKTIGPLAPVSNPERFTSARKVEKWFKRNCGDVLGRDCTASEKANVLAYLTNLR
jgi:hypothetical protein